MSQFEATPISRSQTLAFLQELGAAAVICHAHPDGDAIGSGVGLCTLLHEFGKDVIFIVPTPIPARFRFMTEECPVPVIAYGDTAPEQLLVGRTVITVDTASAEMVGELEEALTGAFRPALSIDHHRVCTPFANRLLLVPEASACAEIIAEMVIDCGKVFSGVALPLYVGINADTGGFRFSNTTSRTHEVAARLLATGIDAAAVNTALYETRTFAEMTAERVALEEMRLYADGKVGIVVFTEELMRKNGLHDEDIDNVVNLIRSVDSVNVAIHLKPRGDGVYKVSMRSKNGTPVAGVCAALGGGGHIYAAGATVVSDTPEGAVKTVLDAVQSVLGVRI